MGNFCELYFENWLGPKSENADWVRDCGTSFFTLIGSGTHFDAQNAQFALTLIPRKEVRLGKFDPVLVRIGNAIVGVGYSPTEVSCERLPLHAIDYGDKVRISDLIKRKLQTGGRV